MAFKTRRQARYAKMRKAGLLPFEAHAFSRVSLEDVPYMKQILAERRELLARATGDDLSQAQYEKLVKQMYIDGSFTKVGKKGDILLDPWQLLRKKEEDYIAKHPDYQSPGKKKLKIYKDFVSKWEQTIDKQRGQV